MSSLTRVEQYWAQKLGVAPQTLKLAGIFVVSFPTETQVDFARIFVKDRTCIISVPEAQKEAVCRRIENIQPEKIFHRATLYSIFGPDIYFKVGRLFQGYAEVEDFTPYQLIDNNTKIRLVTREDEETFYNLSSACDSLQWAHSGVKFLKPHLYGLFLDNQLAALSHYDMWTEYAASIGVITHPNFRNRGYGKAVVSAAIQDAIDNGHLAIYQTLLDNSHSVLLAKRLGFKEYAQTLKVYF